MHVKGIIREFAFAENEVILLYIRGYLNLFPREEGFEDNDYEEIVVIKIDYETAKKFREMRGGMLRKNQWKDLIIRIMA